MEFFQHNLEVFQEMFRFICSKVEYDLKHLQLTFSQKNSMLSSLSWKWFFQNWKTSGITTIPIYT